MTEKTYFIPQDKARVVVVCKAKHKDGYICSRPHAVPANAVWSGTDRGRADEVVGEFKLARRENKKALRRWGQQKDNIAAAARSAAPAFKGYAKSLLESHCRLEPKLEVKIA